MRKRFLILVMVIALFIPFSGINNVEADGEVTVTLVWSSIDEDGNEVTGNDVGVNPFVIADVNPNWKVYDVLYENIDIIQNHFENPNNDKVAGIYVSGDGVSLMAYNEKVSDIIKTEGEWYEVFYPWNQSTKIGDIADANNEVSLYFLMSRLITDDELPAITVDTDMCGIVVGENTQPYATLNGNKAYINIGYWCDKDPRYYNEFFQEPNKLSRYIGTFDASDDSNNKAYAYFHVYASPGYAYRGDAYADVVADPQNAGYWGEKSKITINGEAADNYVTYGDCAYINKLITIDHKWNFSSIEWSDDYSSASARFVSACDHGEEKHYYKDVECEVTSQGDFFTEIRTATISAKNSLDREEHSDQATINKEWNFICTEGDGSKWTKGSSKTLDFTFSNTKNDADTFPAFSKDNAGILYIDGDKNNKVEYINDKDAKISEGSLIVSLNSDYLETLDVGDHTITAQINDSIKATANFTIVKASSSKKTSTTPLPVPNTGIE